jgi:hypothetical protein
MHLENRLKWENPVFPSLPPLSLLGRRFPPGGPSGVPAPPPSLSWPRRLFFPRNPAGLLPRPPRASPLLGWLAGSRPNSAPRRGPAESPPRARPTPVLGQPCGARPRRPQRPPCPPRAARVGCYRRCRPWWGPPVSPHPQNYLLVHLPHDTRFLLSRAVRLSPSPRSRPQPPRSLPARVVFVLVVSSPPSPSSMIPLSSSSCLAAGSARCMARDPPGPRRGAAQASPPRAPSRRGAPAAVGRSPLPGALGLPSPRGVPLPDALGPLTARRAPAPGRPARARCPVLAFGAARPLRDARHGPWRGALPPPLAPPGSARPSHGASPGAAPAACVRRARAAPCPAQPTRGVALLRAARPLPCSRRPQRVWACARRVLARCAQPARPTLFLLLLLST